MNPGTLRQRLDLPRTLPNLTAGLISGVISVVISISFAVLIFSGPLADRVGNGIGLVLLGGTLISAIVALMSSLSITMAGPQDSPAAILALTAAALIGTLAATATHETVYVTVVAAIALSSILTGAFFLALGRFKLGRLIRFIPYPVIGGFLAGTGWLLVQGSLSVIINQPLTVATFSQLLQANLMIIWVPAAVYAVTLLIILRRYTQFWIMPALLLAGFVTFYAWLMLTGTSVAQAGARGLLLGPFPQGGLWQPLTPADLAKVDWLAIAGQFDKLATVLIIGAVSLLLNASGIELATRRDLDLNRELQAAGVANLAAGLVGSPIGYHYLGDTVLAQRVGAQGRLAGLTAATVCGVTLLFGSSLLAILPRPVLGGLLLFLGLSFLVEWVYDAWFKLPRLDYCLVLLILFVVGAVGFLEGVGVGILIAIVLFVVQYSRINVVKHAFSGAIFHSAVDRPLAQREQLRAQGDQLYVLQLHGFIFFGTSYSLLNQIRQRLADTRLPPLRFVALDFSRVSGFDSSAMSSFVRLKQLAEMNQIRLVFTHLSADMERQLTRTVVVNDAVLRIFPTLDYGLEWCEDQMLEAEPVTAEMPHSVESQLAEILRTAHDVERFMCYLDKEEAPAAHVLIHQGAPADCIYFLATGSATAHFELPDNRTVRLRTMRCGTVIGEVGLYQDSVRTASVITDQPSLLYRLSAASIERMEHDDPDLAVALHHFIARLMADRLAENNYTLIAVLD
jgi:sulfate permease, SulP family